MKRGSRGTRKRKPSENPKEKLGESKCRKKRIRRITCPKKTHHASSGRRKLPNLGKNVGKIDQKLPRCVNKRLGTKGREQEK